jgi:hypothetical protein
MKETERIRFTLEEMNKVFPGISDYFELRKLGYHLTGPKLSPRAASPRIFVATLRCSALHIPGPEGRVHFAGEGFQRGTDGIPCTSTTLAATLYVS